MFVFKSAYCSAVCHLLWRRGRGGTLVALKSYKRHGAPYRSLRLLSIVTSGEGGIGGRHNRIKNNGAPSLCH